MGSDWKTLRKPILVLTMLACASAILSWRHATGSTAWTIGVPAWALSIAFALAAAFLVDRAQPRAQASSIARWSVPEGLLLAAILAAACAVRLVALTEYPGHFHNDEMNNGLDARRFLGAAPPPLFETGWTDHPNLSYFLLSLPMHFLGDGLFALRLNSVVYGVATILGTYLIMRLLFDWKLAALVAVLTVSFHVHVNYSRSGMHVMQAAVFVVWAICAFAYGWRRRSVVLYGSAGVILGLGLQAYSASYITPLVLGGWAAAQLLTDRQEGWRMVRGLAIALAFALLTYAPMMPHFLQSPHTFGARARGVYVFAPENRAHVTAAVGSYDVWPVLRYQLVHSFAFFAGGRDTSGQYAFDKGLVDPFLQWPWALGLLLALASIRHSGAQLMLIWVVLTTLLGSVIAKDPPSSTRMIACASIVPFFAALALREMARMPRRKVLRVALAAAALALCAGSVWWNLDYYFRRYPVYAPAARRDHIARIVERTPGIRAIVNATGVEENFDSETYRFVAPHLQLLNTAMTPALFATVPRPALVMVSPLDAAHSVPPDAVCLPLDAVSTGCLIR